MKVADIINALESFAPLAYQENYDNSGLQVGTPHAEVTGVLFTLDVTEAVLREAIDKDCNMIVAHHPLIFSGLKRITGSHYTERIIRDAIRNDIHIYAAHTNMDNVRNGVNRVIANQLGLVNTSILAPKSGTLVKLYTYVPESHAEALRSALFEAGGGQIGNYSECSFNTEGTGTFRPGTDANPTIGSSGGERESVREIKVEILLPEFAQKHILKALKANHPYEEVAYEIIRLENQNQEIGAGMIGELPAAMTADEWLQFLKERMNCDCIRYTRPKSNPIRKIAVCGGSGSFLLKDAIRAGADVLVTADFKYHQFFDADGKIMIADIGHYESEQFTVRIFADILRKKFPNFALLLSTISTNPINYYH